MKNLALALMLAVATASCKYQTACIQSNQSQPVQTSIAVVKKDPNGYLRNFVAQEMAKTPCLDFKQWDAKYELKIDIVGDRCSKISFMWDRHPGTNIRKEVFYNSEGSREIVAKVQLVDARTKKIAIKPFFLRTFADYDFVNPTNRSNIEFDEDDRAASILQYSLGQLDSEEGAKIESYRAAYQRLAEKIVSRLAKSRINTEG